MRDIVKFTSVIAEGAEATRRMEAITMRLEDRVALIPKGFARISGLSRRDDPEAHEGTGEGGGFVHGRILPLKLRARDAPQHPSCSPRPSLGHTNYLRPFTHGVEVVRLFRECLRVPHAALDGKEIPIINVDGPADSV
jgi:hypothetical protein